MKTQKEINLKKQTVKFTMEISLEEAQEFVQIEILPSLELIPDWLLLEIITKKLKHEK